MHLNYGWHDDVLHLQNNIQKDGMMCCKLKSFIHL